jgi:hypothetical protein
MIYRGLNRVKGHLRNMGLGAFYGGSYHQWCYEVYDYFYKGK